MSRVNLRLITLILLPAIALGTVTVNFALVTSDKVIASKGNQGQFATQLAQMKKLQWQRELLDDQYGWIDPDLPGISTAEADFFFSQYREAVRGRDFQKAERFLGMAREVAAEILSDQEAIIPQEIARLEIQMEANLQEAEEIFVATNDLRGNYEESCSGAFDDYEHLAVLRNGLVELAERISERRLQMEGATKSVVIVKNERKLYLFENERLVYAMPVSLGRKGKETRNGEFKILDKTEQVWGYYQIWMPYWMGIYFAGSSENGFHGIPWDNTGNRYWVNDIGVRNVTYGCIMALDADMRRFFSWAEVGTPVTIVN